MKIKLLLEIIWWLATIILVALILLPIYFTLPAYPFLLTNAIFIVGFVTLSRHLFFLKHSLIAPYQIIRIALIFVMIPFIFYQIQELNMFQTILDEEGIEPFVGTLPFEDQKPMMKYIYNETLLFAVGSILTSIAFPFRMIVSVWRFRNRNGKV
jgi:hypothetical protein